MNKKFLILSICSFIFSFTIHTFTYFLYHYYTADGFSTVWHEEPLKPFVTLLFGIWGTLFLFSGVTFLLVSIIFNGRK